MTRTQYTTHGISGDFIFPVLVFALSLALYIMTLPATVLPGDGGGLIAASHTLSISHPPGNPLYLILGKVFASAAAWGTSSRASPGEPGYR